MNHQRSGGLARECVQQATAADVHMAGGTMGASRLDHAWPCQGAANQQRPGGLALNMSESHATVPSMTAE